MHVGSARRGGHRPLLADRTLFDLAVQVHSIDPPHACILRSIQLVAEEVAPALGWQPRNDETQRAEEGSVA